MASNDDTVAKQAAALLEKSRQPDAQEGLGVSEAGVGASLVGLSTEEAAALQKNGMVKLIGDRVRSLKYYGNQYESSEVVKAAKSGQLALVNINKVAGGAGYVLTGLSVASDIYEYQNGSLSQGRFIYRSAGNAAVLAIALGGSGGYAAVLGVSLYGAEKFHAGMNHAADSFYRNTSSYQQLYEGFTGDYK